MTKNKNRIHGWLNVDKPYGLTSTQTLGKIKKALNPSKAGHGGTLDPLATGCLPVALGEATKTVSFVMEKTKVYEFDVTWGEQRTTDDLEGDILQTSDKRPVKEQVEALLPQFTGLINQTPPLYSAVKVDGKRAYDKARNDEEVILKTREVRIDSFEILSHDRDRSRFRVTCGKGTYVRSLARDMGHSLGCFGHVSTLRRTRVGPLTEKNMISLDILENFDHIADLDAVLLPLDVVLDDIPAIGLTPQEAGKLRNGGELVFSSKPDIERMQNAGIDFPCTEEREILAKQANQPVAVTALLGAKLKPVRVFNF